MKTRLRSPSPESSDGRRCSVAHRLAFVALALVLMMSCSPPVERPTGPAAVWENATETFAKGDYNKALEVLDNLNNADPPNAYTDRARVLSAVILSGQVNAYKTVTDSYAKGVEKAKDPSDKVEFGRQRTDNILRGSKLALALGQVAMQLTKGGTLPKELVLGAPYPKVNAPVSIPALSRVRDGLKIGEDDEGQIEMDAPKMGVADALADALGTDRDGAKSKLNAGPVKLDEANFGIYLGNEVLTAAALYDPKHGNDPEKFKTLAGIANDSAQAAAAVLKANPDPAKAKRLKNLQDQVKATGKTLQNWMTLLRR